MPIRLLSLTWPIWSAVAAQLIAAGDATVWGQGSMRAWCIIGSLMGAMGALYFTSAKQEVGPSTLVRLMAAKFVISAICGMLATPLLLRWRGLPLDPDWLMGASGAVALVAVSAIHVILPRVEKAFAKKADQLVDKE